MIAKLICCHVRAGQRERFSSGQVHWQLLQHLDGFLGQTGGWPEEDDFMAVIVGLWRDADSYERFMANAHDGLFEGSGQKGSYAESSIQLFEQRLDWTGEAGNLGEGVAYGKYLRIALCEVFPHRQAHFEQVQRDVWIPGMAQARGMLAGLFSISRTARDRYLVVTFWRDRLDHERYLRGHFRELRQRAEVELDVANLTGLRVPVEEAWRVGPQTTHDATATGLP